MNRNWKRYHPSSLPDAMSACLDFARDKHHLSVEQIADLMSLPNKWAIYKWVEGGSLPMIRLRAFEHACRCDFVSRWYVHSGGKLLLDIPTGRSARDTDVIELHEHFNQAMQHLVAFYKGAQDTHETLGALTTLMEELAWHRGNVDKHAQPELEFGGEQA